MTPEKLDQWLYKPCPGGVTLQLAHGQIGTHADLVVASWTREEVLNARECGVSHADVIYGEAQDHADSIGEACKFLIQWVSEAGRALRSIVHRVAPSEPTNNVYAANADAVSMNSMIAQFLGHIHQQQKVCNTNNATLVTNMQQVGRVYEQALSMQQSMLREVFDLLKSSRKEIAQLSADAPTPETAELAKLKAKAFEKLIELGPDVVRVIVHAAGGSDAPEAPAMNGHNAEASA